MDGAAEALHWNGSGAHGANCRGDSVKIRAAQEEAAGLAFQLAARFAHALTAIRAVGRKVGLRFCCFCPVGVGDLAAGSIARTVPRFAAMQQANVPPLAHF